MKLEENLFTVLSKFMTFLISMEFSNLNAFISLLGVVTLKETKANKKLKSKLTVSWKCRLDEIIKILLPMPFYEIMNHGQPMKTNEDLIQQNQNFSG